MKVGHSLFSDVYWPRNGVTVSTKHFLEVNCKSSATELQPLGSLIPFAP